MRDRDITTGMPELETLLAALPPRASVLDRDEGQNTCYLARKSGGAE